MIEIRIERNDSGQRLDRFLRKYLKKASLGQIYRMIRKNLKINGKRGEEGRILEEGDILNIYISDGEFERFREKRKSVKVKKSFKVLYEDENMLVVSKPFGLLTHGDRNEKKNHLTNQVINYLIEKGDYVPTREKTFAPSPVNRLDRNTTGIVIFGKNADSLKLLNKKIKNRSEISKFYLAVVSGIMEKELKLRGNLVKDGKTNTVKITHTNDEESDTLYKDVENRGKNIETVARPLCSSEDMTLVEVELVTGRTHQIRAHLAAHGFPIIGDAKYGDLNINAKIKRKYDLTTQLLHAYKIVLNGKEIEDQLPQRFEAIVKDNFNV